MSYPDREAVEATRRWSSQPTRSSERGFVWNGKEQRDHGVNDKGSHCSGANELIALRQKERKADVARAVERLYLDVGVTRHEVGVGSVWIWHCLGR